MPYIFLLVISIKKYVAIHFITKHRKGSYTVSLSISGTKFTDFKGGRETF